jgi:hypothetical protein
MLGGAAQWLIAAVCSGSCAICEIAVAGEERLTLRGRTRRARTGAAVPASI